MSDNPTSPTGDPSKPTPQTERWTYGGLRRGKGDRKLDAWYDESGTELLFAHTKRGPIVGSDYEVRVGRGDTVSLYDTPPRYVGMCEDAERRATLMATDRAVRAWYDLARREKQDKADDPLMNACDEVAAILARVPAPQRQLAIYAAYERITRKSWR